MKIGIDMDGTLTNPYADWQRYFNREGKLHEHSELCVLLPPTWEYHHNLCKWCFAEVLDSESLVRWAGLQPGAADAIGDLAAFADLYLITHRPPEFVGAVSQMLGLNGLSSCFEDIYVGWEDKGQIAGADGFNVDVLIDDKPDNLLSAMRAGVAPLCFAAPYNESVRSPRIGNWIDAVDHIIDNYAHLVDLSAWTKG